MSLAQNSCQAHFALPLLSTWGKPGPPQYAHSLVPKSYPCTACATNTGTSAVVLTANVGWQQSVGCQSVIRCTAAVIPPLGLHDLQISGTGPWWLLPGWPQSACWRTEQRSVLLPRPPAASLPPLTPLWARRCGWALSGVCSALLHRLARCCRCHPQHCSLQPLTAAQCGLGETRTCQPRDVNGCTCNRQFLS